VMKFSISSEMTLFLQRRNKSSGSGHKICEKTGRFVHCDN
jgi:hypothetical protein